MKKNGNSSLFVFWHTRPENNVWWLSSTKTTNNFGQQNLKKIPVCLFLDNRGLEIMFEDHLVREQAFLDYKKYWFYIAASCHSRIFLQASIHDFGQKLQISSLFVLGQNGPWSSVWWLSR